MPHKQHPAHKPERSITYTTIILLLIIATVLIAAVLINNNRQNGTPVLDESTDMSTGSPPEASQYQPPQKVAADSAPFAILTPEMWQTRIEKLLEQGETEKASSEMIKLEEAYPDFDIDKTLLERLQHNER
jgi:hypothetical protein